MNDTDPIKKLLSDDVKLVIATASIVTAILGSFFTVRTEVEVLAEKIDNGLGAIQDQQKQFNQLNAQITSNDSMFNSRLTALETEIKYK